MKTTKPKLMPESAFQSVFTPSRFLWFDLFALAGCAWHYIAFIGWTGAPSWTRSLGSFVFPYAFLIAFGVTPASVILLCRGQREWRVLLGGVLALAASVIAAAHYFVSSPDLPQ